eukprot:TRINITY_DN1449_c0_g1_i1.p1 TRINITY_DN1449_c0_g1~~TRINITY_DN1449_c0_g1_i1.p1  ORF type:complete len:197 (+),score=12.02 TRINITY_DN1449_c0_g1_i1:84-593(+)
MVNRTCLPLCTCCKCKGITTHPGDTIPQIVEMTKIHQQKEPHLFKNEGSIKNQITQLHQPKRKRNDISNKTQEKLNFKRIKISEKQTIVNSSPDVHSTYSTINPIGTLSIFPQELLEEILSYLNFKTAVVKLRTVNKYFYELITGYNQVGLTGVQHKPTTTLNSALLIN